MGGGGGVPGAMPPGEEVPRAVLPMGCAPLCFAVHQGIGGYGGCTQRFATRQERTPCLVAREECAQGFVARGECAQCLPPTGHVPCAWRPAGSVPGARRFVWSAPSAWLPMGSAPSAWRPVGSAPSAGPPVGSVPSLAARGECTWCLADETMHLPYAGALG